MNGPSQQALTGFPDIFCPSSEDFAPENAVPGDIKKAKSLCIALTRATAAGSRYMLLHRTMRVAAIHRRLNLALPVDRVVLPRQPQGRQKAGGSS